MEVRDLILRYLDSAEVMQLGTAKDNQPWISNVHFVHDTDGNLYWLSVASRRHSIEIAENPRVAASIVVKQDLPVIGLQAAGIAERVNSLATIKAVMPRYIKKHGTGRDFYTRAVAGINTHKLYRMRPTVYSLFDEVHFPKSAPQVWMLQ